MEKFKSFTRKTDIDSIKSKSKPDKDPENVSSTWRDIVVESPPMNSSDEVKSEMMVLKRETESRTKEDETSIETHDMCSECSVLHYMDENKLSWDRDVVDNLTDIGGKVSRHFKNIFLRARPYQLEKPLGIKINQSMDRDTDKGITPSYPAGHSTQSRLVAEYYAKKYPDHRKGLIDAANESGLGRIKAGWHYPSDNKAGIQLAKDILPLLEL
jgi:acid phosphatase (class A)